MESRLPRNQRKGPPSFDGGKKKNQQNIMTKQSKQTGIPPSGFWFRSRLDWITMSIGFVCFASSIIMCFGRHLDLITSSNGIINFVSSTCMGLGLRLNPTVTRIGFLITTISSIGSCFGSRLNQEKTSIGFLSGKLKFRIIILALLLNTASSFIVMENPAQKV